MRKQLLFVAFAIIIFGSCHNYSTGWRSGVLIKFSKKGVIWKTYEGTVNLGGLKKKSDKDGNESFVANTWDFSIDNNSHRNENAKALADSLDLAMNEGYLVKLHYNQERATNCFCQRGSENYFIDSVKLIR